MDTGVRIPVGTPLFKHPGSSQELPGCFFLRVVSGLKPRPHAERLAGIDGVDATCGSADAQTCSMPILARLRSCERIARGRPMRIMTSAMHDLVLLSLLESRWSPQ